MVCSPKVALAEGWVVVFVASYFSSTDVSMSCARLTIMIARCYDSTTLVCVVRGYLSVERLTQRMLAGGGAGGGGRVLREGGDVGRHQALRARPEVLLGLSICTTL
jgi:hypothetical protein